MLMTANINPLLMLLKSKTSHTLSYTMILSITDFLKKWYQLNPKPNFVKNVYMYIQTLS
jgi:hypothetical protein